MEKFLDIYNIYKNLEQKNWVFEETGELLALGEKYSTYDVEYIRFINPNYPEWRVIHQKYEGILFVRCNNSLNEFYAVVKEDGKQLLYSFTDIKFEVINVYIRDSKRVYFL